MSVQTSLTVSGGYYPEAVVRYVTGACAPTGKDWVFCQTHGTDWRYAVGTLDGGVYRDVLIYTITSDTTGYKVSAPVSADTLTISNPSGYIYYGTGVSDPTFERSDLYALTAVFAIIVCFAFLLCIRIFRHVS